MTDFSSPDTPSELLAKANDQVVFMTSWVDFISGLNASVGFGDILQSVSLLFRQIFGLDQTILIVMGPAGELSATRTLPGRSDSYEGFRVTGDEWLIKHTFEESKRFLGNPTELDGFRDLVGHDDSRWIISVPLISTPGPIGCLIGGSHEPDFDGSDFESSVANAAAEVTTASERVVVFERSRIEAVTDPLTELYNRRYFMEALRNEIRKAQRLGYALGLFMIDIDDFKLVNDTYGHMVGDHVLREVAGGIEESVRASDLVARFGGEEFSVILVGCPEDALLVLAEKVRSTVEEMTVDAARPKRHGISVSVGAAYFGDANMNAEDLIAKADAALYKAKNEGKNRVVVSSTALT